MSEYNPINDIFDDSTEPDYFGYTDPSFGFEDRDPTLYENKGANQYTHSWVDTEPELAPEKEYITKWDTTLHRSQRAN